MRRALLLIAVGTAACSLFVDTGGLDTETDAGADAMVDAAPDVFGDAATDAVDATATEASPEAEAGPCPSGMIEVPGAGYCIDATEVTRGQYAAFLAANPPSTGQPAECAWNASYVPSTWDVTKPTLPVAYVDWCDAYAYCKWAGKRMCGAIGGGALPWGSATDPAVSQWYRACGADGQLAYPYGGSYVAGACNAPTGDAGLEPVASFPQCVGGYAGLYDMAGNVEEWQDSCDGTLGAADSCREQAGTFQYVAGSPAASTRCDFLDSDVRTAQYPDVGIRCCSP